MKPAAVLLVVGLAALFVAACAGGGAEEGALAAPGTETVALKVMSFNVLYGAGLERGYDEHIPARFQGRSRVPELLDFLRETDPDVLSLQESAGMDVGDPSLADEIAELLDADYVLAHDAWDLHVILFSKFPIVSAAYVSRDHGFSGVALWATLRVSDSVEVGVLAVHLNSMSRETRLCQVGALLEIAAGAAPGPLLIAGDMNFRPGSAEFMELESHGWQLAVAQPAWPIDQVWVSPETEFTAGTWWDAFEPPADISDHLPIGIDLELEADRRALDPAVAAPEPQTLDYACALLEP